MEENKGLRPRYWCGAQLPFPPFISKHSRVNTLLQQAHLNAGEQHLQQRGCIGTVYLNGALMLGKYGDSTMHMELLHSH